MDQRKENDKVETDILILKQDTIDDKNEDVEEKKQFNPYASANAQYPDMKYNQTDVHEDYGGYDEGFEGFNLKGKTSQKLTIFKSC